MSNYDFKSPQEFLVDAYKVACGSPDPSTQNGAVIPYYSFGSSNGRDDGHGMLCVACNTLPYGVKVTPERLQRPLKYNYIEHAERGSVYAAAKSGVPLFDKTMYCPWFACADCARAIICTGIRKVVGHQRMMDATPAHWKESIAHAFAMFEEAGVETVLIKDKLPDAPQILFNGELWQP